MTARKPQHPKAKPMQDGCGEALRNCDQMAQDACADVALLVSAALHRLAMDPHALIDVHGFLRLIAEKAQELQDSINSTAEDCGFNYVDTERAKLLDRLKVEGFYAAKKQQLGGAA